MALEGNPAPSPVPGVPAPEVAPLAPAASAPPCPSSIPSDQERQELLDHRKTLFELDARASDSFDNALLTLCAGALALSVSLGGTNALLVLGLAQTGFASALLAEVLALRSGRLVSLKRLIDDHDARLLGQISSIPRERRKDATYYLKNYALAAFVFGVCTMIFFVRSQTIGK
jgi:hypothetical protein